MSTADNPWIDFAKTHPEKGLVEWRIPSSAIPGMVVIVAAHMRVRGAGFDTVLSPIFDYWDGYRVYVPSGLQWRKAGLHNIRTCDEKVIGIDGLDVTPCIYCGKIPAIQTCDQRSPHQSGAWRFQCCGWGSTPTMKDPREIEKVRRTAFSRATALTERREGGEYMWFNLRQEARP